MGFLSSCINNMNEELLKGFLAHLRSPYPIVVFSANSLLKLTAGRIFYILTQQFGGVSNPA